MNFFKNLSISSFVISLYGLQVSRSLKTCKTIKSGLQCTTFFSQILCLQVSVLIIHGHCIQLSFSRTIRAIRTKLINVMTSLRCYDNSDEIRQKGINFLFFFLFIFFLTMTSFSREKKITACIYSRRYNTKIISVSNV